MLQLAEPVERVEQITGTAGQAVEPADHHGVVRMGGLEQPEQLLALAIGAGPLLGVDPLASGGLQRLELRLQRLRPVETLA